MNVKTIEQKILSFISDYELITNGDKLLIALSGGADSVFAISFLNKFSSYFKIQMIAVHVDHKLRGEESDRDREFCKKLCKFLNVPLVVKSIDIKKEYKKSGLSIEEYAREFRYNEFQKILIENNCQKIITAHHLNDNVETILLNLFRGTGFNGLAGIPIKRDNIVRPLLAIRKEEIEFWLSSNERDFVLDSSNNQNEYTRNIIRNKIIPIIRKDINPAFDKNLFQMSQIVRNEYSKIETDLLSVIKKYLVKKDNGIEIQLKLFSLNDYFEQDLIRVFFKKYFDYSIQFQKVKQVAKLINSQKGKVIELKGDLICTKENDCLLVSRKIQNIDEELDVSIGEEVKIANKVFSICEVDNYVFNENTNTEYICGDNLEGLFKIRNWREGDKFIPLGRKSEKKVSDFLTDLKIKTYEKKTQKVLLINERIIWVIGKRLNEKFKITPKTEKILRLCLN